MKTHRFNLVIPVDLWVLLKERAAENRRSVTQEILEAIEDHLAEKVWRITDEDSEVVELVRAWAKTTLDWKKVVVWQPTSKRELRRLQEMIDREIEEE